MVTLSLLCNAKGFTQVTQATEDGSVTSPDGKYVAKSAEGEAAVDYLTVHKGLRQFLKPTDLRASDVSGFAWVPGKPHTLVWATIGLYGSAGLRLWTPEKGVHDLVRHVDRENDGFTLNEIRRQGNNTVVIYRKGDAEATIDSYRKKRLSVRF
jgi:hypothetical protein